MQYKNYITVSISLPVIQDGETGLMWAVEGGYLDAAKVLLEAKADPNITDKVKSTTAT